MDPAEMNKAFSSLKRRSFLKQTGQLLIGFSLFSLPGCSSSGEAADQTEEEETLPESLADHDSINAWIRIEESGRVTILTGKTELGQGIRTALMQIAAEELDVNMERLSIILADTGQTPDERYTAGSASIENSGTAIRNAAAEARQQLLALAEEALEIPAAQLKVNDGNVQAAGSNGNTVSYWQLLEGRRLEGKVTGNAPLKDPDSYRLIGTPYPRADIRTLASGGAVYVQDIRLPAMVHGRVLRSPSYKAKLLQLPEEQAKAMPGVLKLVREGSFVAVIAEQEYEAVQALAFLRREAQWQQPEPLPESNSLFEDMLREDRQGDTIEDSQRLEEQLEGATHRIEAVYTRPYQMHASIGPSCALAQWQNGQLSIWTHSQGVYPLRQTLAHMLKMEEENIRCMAVPGSGCYGHNGADDVAADAALLSRAYPGRPIRVQWMREDEHLFEPYGSAMRLQLKAGLESQGRISAWQSDVWSDSHSTRPGGDAGSLLPARYLKEAHELPTGGYSGGNYRNAKPLYDFPAIRVVSHSFKGPLRTSALRSLGAYANIFALESFMDELALKAGQGPLAFRLRHLRDERGRAVLKAVARMINWETAEPEPGRGSGIAFARYKNSAAYCAVAAEVFFDSAKQTLKVLRLAGAIDAGQTINPDGLKNQTEGGMIQSCSWTLLEQVLYDRQHVTSSSWESYPILRFSGVPQVTVEVIDRPGEAPLGAGEAAQGPTAAAIGNAVFQATGVRVRDLPITADKIST
jgi:nicotinate dehydrogenase subunit B